MYLSEIKLAADINTSIVEIYLKTDLRFCGKKRYAFQTLHGPFPVANCSIRVKKYAEKLEIR